VSEPAPRFDRQELIPAIVQDATTQRVLMTAFMNRAAYERTLETGQAWFWSRSRQELWHKGATSGHFLNVRGIQLDCDADAILLLVDPTGPACHTNATSCFFQEVQPLPDGPSAAETASELWDVVNQRLAERPEGSYIAKLAAGGLDRFAKKVGEEATEVVIAAKNEDPAELTREMADLWFHCYLVLANAGVRPDDVWAELARRRSVPGELRPSRSKLG
jgi:phosphoribosyl-ATP pyrophosphohydrolase/phosphoribosyl-AMP cyclohydrolase